MTTVNYLAGEGGFQDRDYCFGCLPSQSSQEILILSRFQAHLKMEWGDTQWLVIADHPGSREVRDPVSRPEQKGRRWLVVPFVAPCPGFDSRVQQRPPLERLLAGVRNCASDSTLCRFPRGSIRSRQRYRVVSSYSTLSMHGWVRRVVS